MNNAELNKESNTPESNIEPKLEEQNHAQPRQDVDIFRNTFMRYMGYSNEVGEAFRPIVPKTIVAASYGLAVGYVCMDTFDKSMREHLNGSSQRAVAIRAGDVFTWQMLASVIIPGVVINRITATTRSLLNKAPSYMAKTLPTMIGLASIPLIVHPIDRLVDHIMDSSYRKRTW